MIQGNYLVNKSPANIADRRRYLKIIFAGIFDIIGKIKN